jgi:cytochrome c biogenesis protein CcdA
VLPVGYAFGAGMVAAVNPCGFAMLPAYLSLYLGAQEEGFANRPVLFRFLRALLVGAVVSSGFVLLFGLAGSVISAGGNALLTAMPWVRGPHRRGVDPPRAVDARWKELIRQRLREVC